MNFKGESMYFKNRGITLIEAIASITILMFVLTIFIQNNNQRKEIERQGAFATDLTNIFYAFDRRITRDGFDATLWDQTTWNTSDEVKDDLFALQFIGLNNDICGDPSGWAPVDTTYNEASLVPCGFYQNKSFPYDLTVTSELELDALNEIERAVFYLEFDNDLEFEDNFSNVLGVINQAKAKLPTGISSASYFEFWDMGADTKLNSSVECYNNKSNCAIRGVADFTGGATSLTGDFLKTDGTNDMLAPISFADNAGNIQMCQRWEKSAALPETWSSVSFECGIIGGEGEAEVEVAVDVVTADEFLLDGTCEVNQSAENSDGNASTFSSFDPEQYTSNVPCGVYLEDPTDNSGEGYIVTKNLSANTGYFQEVSAQNVNASFYKGNQLGLYSRGSVERANPNVLLDSGTSGNDGFLKISDSSSASANMNDDFNSNETNAVILNTFGLKAARSLDLLVGNRANNAATAYNINLGPNAVSGTYADVNVLGGEFTNFNADVNDYDVLAENRINIRVRDLGSGSYVYENVIDATSGNNIEAGVNKSAVFSRYGIYAKADAQPGVTDRIPETDIQPGEVRVKTDNGFIHDGNVFSATSTLGIDESDPDTNLSNGNTLPNEERRLHVTKDYIDSTIRLFEILVVGHDDVVIKPTNQCAPYDPVIVVTPASSYTYLYDNTQVTVSSCIGDNSRTNIYGTVGQTSDGRQFLKSVELFAPACDKTSNELIYSTYAIDQGNSWRIVSRLSGWAGSVDYLAKSSIANVYCDKIRTN